MRRSEVTDLEKRTVRVVIRMGGTSADVAMAINCTKVRAVYVAHRIGLRFGTAIRVSTARFEPAPQP